MKQRIYIDTSVVGGYFDSEFSTDTIPFFQSVMSGDFSLIVSELLIAELSLAPDFVNNIIDTIPPECKEFVPLTQEATVLADMYITANVVGKTSRADCQHIAITTINNADVLVSWNFKHIVNLNRIRGYNAINYQHGYRMLEIRTPKEVLNYE